jgi:hypothetical protein
MKLIILMLLLLSLAINKRLKRKLNTKVGCDDGQIEGKLTYLGQTVTCCLSLPNKELFSKLQKNEKLISFFTITENNNITVLKFLFNAPDPNHANRLYKYEPVIYQADKQIFKFRDLSDTLYEYSADWSEANVVFFLRLDVYMNLLKLWADNQLLGFDPKVEIFLPDDANEVIDQIIITKDEIKDKKLDVMDLLLSLDNKFDNLGKKCSGKNVCIITKVFNRIVNFKK